MTWTDPDRLWLLLLLAPLLGVFAYAWVRRRKMLGLFVSPHRVEELAGSLSNKAQWLRAAGLLAAMGCLIAALSGPRWGFREFESRATSLDVVIAIDTSRSMLANDLAPSRMVRAKLAALDLLKLGEGDRFALVPFAGVAFLQCPLTVDHEALRQHVDLVQVDVIPHGGTSIAAAINTALEMFGEEEMDRHKVLVILTDGEEHEPDAVKAAELAGAQGMKIFTVGMGTPEGELVPVLTCPSCDEPNVPNRSRCRECGAYLTDWSTTREYLKDDGRLIRSKLNEPMLQELATETGGFYLRHTGTDSMDWLYKNGLAPLPKSEHNPTTVRRQKEQFQWFLGAGVLLLLAELLWPKGRRSASKTNAATAVMLALCLLPLNAIAADKPSLKKARGEYADGNFVEAQAEYEKLLTLRPGDPPLLFNAGAAAFQAEKYPDAERHFRSALRTPDLTLQQRVFYNLGNTHFRLGEVQQKPKDKIQVWEESARHYEAAVGLISGDKAAQRNLTFVRRMISEEKQRMEQLTDELPLDGINRFKQKDEIALRVYPPSQDAVPEDAYWRMFALDDYKDGVATVSDSLRKLSTRRMGPWKSAHGGRAPAGQILPGEWRFKFEPLFSEFLPIPGPFATGEAKVKLWHYNKEALHGRLPEVPSKAVEYQVTDPAECSILAPGPADDALSTAARNNPAGVSRNEYPYSTMQLRLKQSETQQLYQAVERLADNEPIDFETFNERVIEFLHKNHKYTRETRIPKDGGGEDPVVRWLFSREDGHCEYFAYSHVLLARAAGFPARIACGFHGGKWDEKEKCWVSKQSEAHAWAEIFDGTHWIRVDPTPPEEGEGEGEGGEGEPQENPEGGGEGEPNESPGEGDPKEEPGEGGRPEEQKESEVPFEIQETLRQIKEMLEAMKGDEKPLGAGELGRMPRPPRRIRKNW